MSSNKVSSAAAGDAGSLLLVDEPWPHVRRITLNRPEKRNALNQVMLAQLVDALETAAVDDDVRVVVVTGAGSTFCAGADISEFRASLHRRVPDVYEDGRLLVRLFQLGQAFEKPLIASVNGPALGGGVGLVALCHFAVAADTAVLGATELRIGMFPMVIFPALCRAVGERRALELSLTARVFDAAEAEDIGLVQRVTPVAALEEAVGDVARTIAGWSPVAVQLGMRGVRTTRDVPVGDALEQLNTLRQILQQTDDLHEGTTAFFEKRSPRWTSR